MLTEGTYQSLIASYRGKDIVADLPADLLSLWCDDYAATSPGAEMVSVDLKDAGSTLTYLFDIHLERTIVAYGVPVFATHRRDSSRMAGHPNSAGPNYHRGHLIAHSIGGGTDINLVPQLGKLNIGQFRILERRVRALAKQGSTCLYFVRPIYTGPLQNPAEFEQGVIVPPRQLLYAVHKNS